LEGEVTIGIVIWIETGGIGRDGATQGLSNINHIVHPIITLTIIVDTATITIHRLSIREEVRDSIIIRILALGGHRLDGVVLPWAEKEWEAVMTCVDPTVVVATLGVDQEELTVIAVVVVGRMADPMDKGVAEVVLRGVGLKAGVPSVEEGGGDANDIFA